MEQQTCKTCAYFLLVDGQNTGLCRRYPPYSDFLVIKSPLAGDARQAQRSFFPRINEKEWCGEWISVATHNRKTNIEFAESQITHEVPNEPSGE